MNHYACAGFLILATNIVLAVAVLSRGLYSRVNRFFALSSIAVALYGLGFFLQAVSTTSFQSILAIKVNLLGTILIPIFFIHMVYSILGMRLSNRENWMLYGLEMPAYAVKSIAYKTYILHALWYVKKLLPASNKVTKLFYDYAGRKDAFKTYLNVVKRRAPGAMPALA